MKTSYTRLTLSILAVFIFILFFQWYAQHRIPLTGEAHRLGFWDWIAKGDFLYSVVFCYLFTRCYPVGGILRGILYGFFITLLIFGPVLLCTVGADYWDLAMFVWVIYYFLQNLVAGFIVGLFLKKNEAQV